jgi:hypothetical protein
VHVAQQRDLEVRAEPLTVVGVVFWTEPVVSVVFDVEFSDDVFTGFSSAKTKEIGCMIKPINNKPATIFSKPYFLFFLLRII